MGWTELWNVSVRVQVHDNRRTERCGRMSGGKNIPAWLKFTTLLLHKPQRLCVFLDATVEICARHASRRVWLKTSIKKTSHTNCQARRWRGDDVGSLAATGPLSL